MIPLCEPLIKGNELSYVKECLDTGWVSSVGKYVERFEDLVASKVGVQFAVATVNGTSALHAALLVTGIGNDDEVVTSTMSFIAPANAIRYVGAWPVFMDSEPTYWQMDPQKLTDFLVRECRWSKGTLRNRQTGRSIRALLPVHILGHPVDMGPILEIANRYNLTVIEDASESLGAEYRGAKVGSLGQISCFSFNGNKLVTSGGGGMIAMKDASWAERARYLTTQAKDDPDEYIHREIGYNYRLSNLLAAVGCAQLENLDSFVMAKRRIAETYTNAFSDTPGIVSMQEADHARSTFWLFTIQVDGQSYGMSSRALMHRLKNLGIHSRPLWQPLHLSQAHRSCQSYFCDHAELLFRQCLSLPCSVGLSEQDQSMVIQAVRTRVP